jgi:hypothetical protein
MIPQKKTYSVLMDFAAACRHSEIESVIHPQTGRMYPIYCCEIGCGDPVVKTCRLLDVLPCGHFDQFAPRDGAVKPKV